MTHYLILITAGFLVTAGLSWSAWKFSRLKYLFLQKIITQKIIDCPFFSTMVVKEIGAYILRQPPMKRQELLRAVSQNDFDFIIREISNPSLKSKAEFMLKGKKPTIKSDSFLELMQVGFFLKKQAYSKAVYLLQQIKSDKKEQPYQALKSLYIARIALFEGDMLTASEEAARALKIFQKNNFLYEEAETYFLLGDIYRVSGVFDTAEFMLRAALKMFNFLSAAQAKAAVLGTFGLLMAVQSRFVEAESYFMQAQKTLENTSNKENFYFILSQQAMLKLVQGEFKEAFQQAQQALRGHKTIAGQALASDVLARVSFATQKWQMTIDYATVAAEKYLKQKNYAASFEARYLLAEALVEKKKLASAEKFLRQLIQDETHHKSCFHVANAYTLLGLILLRRGDMLGAKTVFNQALEQELYNDRASGAAIDYANLALLEHRCGNIDAARKNLNAALSCVEGVDEELYDLIKNVQA